MIAEIGLLLLIIALVISISLSVLPVFIKQTKHINIYIPLLAHLNTLALSAAIVILGYLFVVSDFSVAYIANHSNTQLALIYKIAAVWGGHEGSMLFWIVFIALFGSIVIERNKHNAAFCHYFSATIAAILVGFLCFLIFTSSPFERLLPNIPIEGRDLNPILQDIGLVFHPPLLFLGYVGLTICFAGSIATLLASPKAAHQNITALKPWVILSWVTLTGGNAFGSWWAYNELGWGGWWFWDPVENASFIPWLVATAYLHSIILNERLKRFYATTLFIGLLSFTLCLLGTFLVRSGVVQSVHAFATDPSRGMSILALLFVSSVSAFTLFIHRAKHFITDLYANNDALVYTVYFGILLLVASALSILLGTCYPLLYEVMFGHTISVGAPYFNSLFVPMVLLISIAMGIAPTLRYRHLPRYNTHVAIMTIASLLMAAGCWYIHAGGFLYLCGCLAASWLLLTIGYVVYQHHKQPGTSVMRFSAMIVAHLGLVVSIVGATTVSNFEQEELLRMGPGQGKEMAGYIFVYRSTEDVTANSYTAIQANIEVLDSHENSLAFVTPQRRTFNTNAMQLSAAGVKRQLLSDLYVSMGQPLSDSEFLIRMSYKPLVNWIWLGAILMMLGGCISLVSRRVRVKQNQAHETPTVSSPIATGGI